MATTSSQQSANPANNPPPIAARPSGVSGQQPSESPTPGLIAPSPSSAGPTTNGGTNGLLSSTLSNDGSFHTDLRQYPRDGRVRNPVPSKLKDVTEQMKGNFSVMHMDVASHRASEGRDAAAKRTSESTALQAKLAQTDSYVSHQRRANYPRPPGLKQFTSPKKSASVEPVPEIAPVVEELRPLTITETKTEQARLLTLLRTLPPHTVVDQLCKALAFFGGIPEAPPPADGKFPESAEANGSGSLFVGWIAEIFPNLKEPRRRTSIPATQPMNLRRPRGRPKGSKASKSRSDKGMKKGTKGTTNRAQEAQDDSWVDVEDSVLELNEDDDLVEVEGPSENAPSTPPQLHEEGQFNNTPMMGSTGGFKSINDANTTLGPGSSIKRRGRPKGSKNRPKDASGVQQANQSAESASANPNSTPVQADHALAHPIPPKVTPVPVPIPMFGEQPKRKANAGRPKGSKNRPKASSESAGQDGTTSQQLQTTELVNHQNNQHPARMPIVGPSFTGSTTTSSIADGANSQSDQRSQLLPPPAMSNSQTPTPQVKESSIVGKKRKRQSAPIGTIHLQTDGASDGGVGSNATSQQTQASLSQATSVPIPQVQPSAVAVQSIQQSSANVNNTPSTKRPRKSQESGSLQTAKRSTPNNIGNKNSASSTATSLDQNRQSNQISIPSQNHTQAEGLEAHYERIAALQNRSDPVQSNANRSQKQQQHQTTTSMGNTASPTPAEGLEAHYERFTALQNRQDNARQQTANRQQMQQTTQSASPISSQASKAPQMPSTLATHQQSRPSQNYYQTQTLNPSYNTQPSAYSTSQRQTQHMATGSPGTGLVQHMTNSPQFGAQSNSPLLQSDTNYRGSPSLVHSSTGYPPRRTPSASPLDNNYRTGGATGHGVANHSPHFGARQTPTTTHSTSHSAMPSTFAPSFDSSFLELQNLDSGNSHGALGLGTGSYGLSSGGVPSQQRTTGSSAASLYSSTTGMNNSYLPSSNVSRATQNRWPS
ncbi:uncharacterized protein F4812DRAFT_398192 [Daldinia caldariorum]|uniref:uncharacterized protein n=1 Tax=Daldinia caldariorum TaxID=326644 RepID=UPI002008B3C5|nr:uncharacterized protein F4812DRAFT_398192 [Daldinia caldariorum]KAI1467459.1 hypothetical protein F4812DRAFT_398192 [Daldinia caldariorum]